MSKTWKRDESWWGNPSLELESYSKEFANQHDNNRMVPVFVFGKDDHWSFCVHDGPDSDFSYTGCFMEAKTAQDVMARIDNPRPGDHPLFR